MNKDEFISMINTQVHQSVTPGIKEILHEPPGRKPRNELVQLSAWFNDLPEADQEMAMKISNLASRHATFGFLCLLDGVRAIEDGPNQGELKLFYKKGLKKVLLNDNKGEFLHDMFYALLFNERTVMDGEIT